ncbi:hypothetical protein BKA69DRAFT_1092610 [Paraphysoderma sedebokerense]|nr:hypothetical protein BKA69DRAFT_1092610 [Paraphysoderma sedebokerense]
MKEVEELRKGKVALSELDEFKRNKNVDALKKSKELVRNIEEKIEGYLKEKNDILSKIMDLTRQLETGRKINREYEDSLKIVAAFQNTFKHYISFREGAQNELDRCMRIREESISILQKCQNLPFRRLPSNGNQASYQTNPTAPDTYIAERDLSAGGDNLQRFGPASALSDTPAHFQNSNFISNIKLPMRYEAKESQTNGGTRLEELKEKLVSAQVSPWDTVQKQEHHMSAEMSAWSNLIKRFAVLSSTDEQGQNFPIATANDAVVFTYTEDSPNQEPIAAAQDITVSNIYPKIPSMKQRSNSISRKPVAVSMEPTIPSLTNRPSPAAVNHASTSNPPSPTKLLQQSLSDQVTKLKSQITEGVPTLKNVVQKMMARKQAENTFGTSTTVNIAFQNTEVSEKVATPPSSPTKTSARLYQPTSVNKSAEDKLLPATSSDNLYYNLLKENRTLRSQLESLEAQAATSRRDREYLLQLELLKQQEKRLNKLEKTIVSKNVGKSPAKETVQRALEVEKQSVSTASKEEVIEKWANEQAMLIRLRQQNFGVSSDEKGKEQVHLQMSPRREKQRRRAQEQLEEEKPQEVSSQLTLEALGSTALDTTKTESGKKKNMIKGDSGLGSSGLMEGEEEQARATSELRRARRERERERERKMKRIAGSVPPRSPSPHETTLNRLKAANDKFAEHFVQSVASETAASSATESSSHVEGLGRKSRRSKSQNDAKSRSKSRTKDRGRERDNKERDHEFSLDGSIGVGSGIGMSKRTGAVDLGFGSYVPCLG